MAVSNRQMMRALNERIRLESETVAGASVSGV